MSLTIKQVEEIAELGRLILSEEEKVKFSGQLSAILDYAETIQELDTSGIPPTAQVTGLEGIMRDDVVKASLTQEQVMMNAADSLDGFIIVPAVLD